MRFASEIDVADELAATDLVGCAGGDRSRRRPSRRLDRATRRATSMSCSMSSNVTSAASDSSSSTSRSRSPRDKPDAGSSSIIRSGLVTIAMPTSSWRCWPWERSPTHDSRRSPSQTAWAASRALIRHCSSIDVRRSDRWRPCAADDGEVQVVLDGEAGEQARALVGAGDAEARPATRRQQRAVDTPDRDRAGGRPDVAGHHVEQRGLAGTVRDRGPPTARLGRHRDRCRPRRGDHRTRPTPSSA